MTRKLSKRELNKLGNADLGKYVIVIMVGMLLLKFYIFIGA